MTCHPEDTDVCYGTGDVFADLDIDLTPKERIKIQFALRICETLVERGLTKVDAAKLLDISEPTLSRLTRGRVDDLSIDRLIELVVALGCDVDIALRPSTNELGRVAVRAV